MLYLQGWLPRRRWTGRCPVIVTWQTTAETCITSTISVGSIWGITTEPSDDGSTPPSAYGDHKIVLGAFTYPEIQIGITSHAPSQDCEMELIRAAPYPRMA